MKLKLAAILAVAALSSMSFGVYSINDGTAENSIGLGATGTGQIYWSTSFQITAGNETINTISAMLGFNNGTQATNGSALRVSLCRDVNNDGIGDTGGMVSDLNTVVAGANTNVFQVYNIPDFTFAVGDRFVVSLIVANGAANPFPATIDQTTPVSARNYIAFDTAMDPNNVSAAPAANRGFIEAFGLPGNWMINANSSPVPEPASMAVLGMGALALIRRRRSKKA